MTTMSSTLDADRPAGPRRWGLAFAAIWLFYLLSPLAAAWDQRDSWHGWVGIIATLLFAAVYLAVFITMRWRRTGAPFGAPLGRPMGFGLVAARDRARRGDVRRDRPGGHGCRGLHRGHVRDVPPHQVGLARRRRGRGRRRTPPPSGSPGWHKDPGILFGTLVATLAIWGISQAINRNIEVLQVREENARLALDDERNRFARDLHDILGHSLTVITVKAELANRLLDVDHERARAELEDLERLSRDALADVRRAVDGYRDLTLPGELARARTALSAAEIAADLPNSTDDVPTDRRELFAWTVREGITNVIRHSGARRCTVLLGEHEVEIRDDGRGPESVGAGHGLTGLRERAAALGGTVVTEPLQPGFSLKVVVPR